jgi:aspartate beta-hydroxylase
MLDLAVTLPTDSGDAKDQPLRRTGRGSIMDDGSAKAGALSAQAHAALQGGDAAAALGLIREAEAHAPDDAALKLQRALVLRAARDDEGAIAAIDEALALNPYDYVALLSKAALVERHKGERQAVRLYENALKIVPAEDTLPEPMKAPTARARAVVARAQRALEDHLRARVEGMAAECSPEAQARAAEAIGVLAGVSRVYTSQPLLLHYPRLPAIPFYPRALFPWLGELEAATAMIREELRVAFGSGEGFAPYIGFAPGEPVNQWQDLNHSSRWSALFLWENGERNEAACAACPQTAALLERLPLAQQPGFAPTVMFSALDPGTHIPPHTGSTNARLLVHLPLVVPGEALFRVGGETRQWREGEGWIFDDTLEHEAWNNCDQRRIILIFDIWSPFLEQGEQLMVTEMLKARAEFFAA